MGFLSWLAGDTTILGRDIPPCETDPSEPDPCIHVCLDCLGCETCCGCTDREPATALRPWPCPHTCQTCLGCPDCCTCTDGGDWPA